MSEKRAAENHINQLESHRNYYGTDKHIITLEKQKFSDERRSANLLDISAEKEKSAIAEEDLARKLTEEAKRLNEDAERDKSVGRSVKYVEKDVAPEAGDVNSLRENHRILCDLLDEKSDGNRLRAEYEQSRSELEKIQEKFNKDFGTRVSESEVRQILSTIADKSSLKSESEQFFDQIKRLSESIGAAKAETQNAQELLNQHRDRHPLPEYAITKDEQNLDEDELEQNARMAKSSAEQYRAKKIECEQEISRLESEKLQLGAQKQRLEAQRKRIDDIFVEEELFRNAIKFDSPDSNTSLTETQAVELLKKMEEQVILTRKRQTLIHDERRKIHRCLSTELGESKLNFAKELRARDEENLEQEAASLLVELNTREKNTREELEDCEKHRRLLIIELLNVADHGVQMLRSLANDSKLPDSVGTLARQHFLRINLKKLELPEQQQKIESLLDDIIAEGQTPTGIALLQRAVRKLSQPITVQVLFPDTEAPPRHIKIAEMSKESGGERLTSAVLLYCSLAKQRARERGLRIDVSGSLLLDNPVGTSNRRQFLELQREAARAMNIQLIYTTGVKDFEAIGTLPNIVQLRNERHNEKNQGLLEAVRVLRPEETFEMFNNGK